MGKKKEIGETVGEENVPTCRKYIPVKARSRKDQCKVKARSGQYQDKVRVMSRKGYQGKVKARSREG